MSMMFMLFRILCASYTCISISFIRFENFSSIISSNILSISFSLSSPFGIPIMCGLVTILHHRSHILFSFFSFVFLSAILIGCFSLFYFTDDFFILLHNLVCYSWPLTHLGLSKCFPILNCSSISF